MKGEHWSEVRLQEGAFASVVRLHTEAENGIHLSRLKGMSPTPASTQTIHIHIQTDRGSTGAGKRKQKQSRKSGERNHPDQRTRQELSLQEWDEIKGEGIWQRLMEKTSARKTVGQKA